MKEFSKPGRHFTEAARAANRAARMAKQADGGGFGRLELFIVHAGSRSFVWELRRFGGVVLQRGPETFTSVEAARADGEKALAALCAVPNLPTFSKQESRGRASQMLGSPLDVTPDVELSLSRGNVGERE